MRYTRKIFALLAVAAALILPNYMVYGFSSLVAGNAVLPAENGERAVSVEAVVLPAENGERAVSVEAVEPESWLVREGEEGSVSFRVSAREDAKVRLYVHFVSDTTLMGRRDTVATIARKVSLKAGESKIVRVPLRAADDKSLTAGEDNNGKIGESKIAAPGLYRARGKELAPGFYQLCTHVSSDVSTHASSDFDLESFNVGICPERIVSPQTRRADFDEFWNATLAELAEVPLDAEYELLKDRCSPERNVYKVTFRSFGGVRVGGILAIPVAEGKFPAYIEYMGYGAEVYQYNGADRPDAIQFLVSVRDQGIYKDCKPGDNGRWIDRGLSSKEGFYYRGAFCDVVRAVDFIASLDKTDPTRIFGQGESQGGAFTWIAASLDHRFRAIAPAVPFLSDYEDYAKIVWWPMHEVFEISDKNGIGRDELLEMLSYFDVKNFTDRIECPVKMAFGLQDPTCPPHTNFAGYNNVKTEKSYRCEPLCGHGMWEIQAWSEERDAWFKSFATKL